MKRILLFMGLILLGSSMQAQIRFQKVDPANDQFTIKNYGNDAVDISTYRLCSEFVYAPGPLSALTIVEGSLQLEGGASVTLNGFALTDAAADFGLYLGSGSFGSATSMVDFLQWGNGGNGRENVAVAKGIWGAGSFIEGDGPYVYTGDGTQNGVDAWGLAEANPRILAVDPIPDQFTIKNFGDASIDLSSYRWCSRFAYGPLSALTIEAGTLDLAPGESVTISGITLDDVSADFAIYLPSGGFGSASSMVDFLQWGAGGIGRENVAVSKGIWTAGTFIDGTAPYTYTGDGTQNGAEFWAITTMPNPRFSWVDPVNDIFEITNYGDEAIDISDYRLCSEIRYPQGPLSTLTLESGSLNLGPGESVRVSGWPVNDAAADLGLYLPSGSFGSAANMVDFLQWGAGGIGRENVAATKGIWTAGTFINGAAPYTYTGEGTQNGVEFWMTNDMPNPRFSWVDPVNDIFEITNYGNVAIDISGYRLCSEIRYPQGPLSTLTLESGSLNLDPGESVRISGWPVNDVAADLGLYLPSGSFGSAANMVDFLQWGAGGIGRENVAVTKGIWTAGTFINAGAPYTYIGNGIQNGVDFWTGSLLPDYVAKLTGSQEVQPVVTSGWGKIYAALVGDSLTVWGEFSNLKGEYNANIAGGSHIHAGYAGQNGGPELFLTPTLDPDLKGGIYEMANNTFALSEEQKARLMNRGFYVNIHSTAYASGEIRGQILPKSDAYYMANLFGGNEVPSIMTTASGALALDLQGDQLVVTGSFVNMEGKFNPSIANTGAHLHNGLAGENGGVSIFLNATTTDSISGVFRAVDNTFTLTSEQKEQLVARGLYANLHTTKFGSGELRGQVGAQAKSRYRVNLSGANESIPVLTEATGELLFELMDSMLIVSGTFQNLESDLATQIAGGAHVHMGWAGSNGGVIFPLNVSMDGDMRNGTFEAANNVFTLDSAQMAMLYQRKLYVNIHSQNNLSGELRGQVLPEGMFVLNGFLSGTNEVTPVLTTASGAVKAEVLGDKLTLTGSFDNLSSEVMTALAGGAHLHLAPAGSNGSVAIPLAITLNDGNQGGYFGPMDNRFTISTGMLDTLRMRYGYVNIHSMDIASGELRGQLLQEATAYFTAPLSGTSEVPPIKSDGSGALVAEYLNGKLWVSGSFSGLGSNFNANIAGGAHIHGGLAGQNGAPVWFLNTTLGADSSSGKFQVGNNIFEASLGEVDSMRWRMFYVNIHSTDIPSGELRGNFLPLATAYFTNSLSAKNEVQPQQSTGLGAMKGELHGTKLVVTGAFSGLEGEYAASHLHMGLAGNNGGVVVPLNPTIVEDEKAGIFTSDSNWFDLDEAQIGELLNSGLYANVHSSAIPSGELRGQMVPESNFYPSKNAVITSPEDGSIIDIAGDPNSPFAATWSEAVDETTVAYIWQLAADSNFGLNLVNANVAQSTTFATTFGIVDSLLALAGVQIGDTVTLYHRAVASDGSVCSPGEDASVRLVRGMITALSPSLLNQFSIKIFPSPVNDQAQIEIYSPQNLNGQIRIMDLLGKELYHKEFTLIQGLHHHKLNFSNYRSGIYLVQVVAEGESVQTLKVLKH